MNIRSNACSGAMWSNIRAAIGVGGAAAEGAAAEGAAAEGAAKVAAATTPAATTPAAPAVEKVGLMVSLCDSASKVRQRVTSTATSAFSGIRSCANGLTVKRVLSGVFVIGVVGYGVNKARLYYEEKKAQERKLTVTKVAYKVVALIKQALGFVFYPAIRAYRVFVPLKKTKCEQVIDFKDYLVQKSNDGYAAMKARVIVLRKVI